MSLYSTLKVLVTASILIVVGTLYLFEQPFTPQQEIVYSKGQQATLVTEVEEKLLYRNINTKSQLETSGQESIAKEQIKKQAKTFPELTQAQRTELARVDKMQQVHTLWREAAELESPNWAIDKLTEITEYSVSAAVVKLAATALADLQWQQDTITAIDQGIDQKELQKLRWEQELQQLRATLFNGTGSGQRSQALQFLVSVSPGDAVELIEYANTDPDPTVRLVAIQSAWRLIADGQGIDGDGRILSVVQQATADQDSLVASTASNALSDFGNFGYIR